MAQAAERQKILTRITPLVSDVLVTATKQYDRSDLPAYGTPLGDMLPEGRGTTYKDHVFVFATPQDEGNVHKYTCYFAAPRDNQDLHNWEVTQADIGGNKFDAVARTYVIPRAEYSIGNPAMGSAMPNVPAGKFEDYATFILAVKRQERLNKEFDSHFVVESRVYVRKTTITAIDLDPLNGGPLKSIDTIFHKDEIAYGSTTVAEAFASSTPGYFGIQATGYSRTGRQLSSEFYLTTSAQQVSGTLLGGSVSVSDYYTTEDFYWPAVFTGVRLYNYELRNGGNEVFAQPNFSREAFRGGCRARVQVSWKVTKHSVNIPDTMQPLPIVVNTPFFGFNVGPSLHESGSFQVVTGSHPKYSLNVGTAAEWEATSPTDWPASVLASDEQRPYRGGWLRTQVTIFRPEYA